MLSKKKNTARRKFSVKKKPPVGGLCSLKIKLLEQNGDDDSRDADNGCDVECAAA